MKLKALILDDEYPARKELRFLLGQFEDIEVVGEATNGQEALTLIKALDYSVIFLDIEMPGMNGLELGRLIQELENPPCVVFVSAYDEYAVKAFEVDAVDYLLKPFDEKRLGLAIQKIRKAIQTKGKKGDEKEDGTEINLREGKEEQEKQAREQKQEKEQKQKGIKIDRVPAEKQGKTILINEADIICAFTEKDYVYVKTFNDKMITRFTLKELEARLNSTMFFRTHRCYIVNLHKVKEIVPFFNGTYTLVVEDSQKSEIPVSRAQAKKLKKILGM